MCIKWYCAAVKTQTLSRKTNQWMNALTKKGMHITGKLRNELLI